MKKSVIFILFTGLLHLPQAQATPTPATMAVAFTLVAVATATGHAIKNAYDRYIENKIINETVNTLYLSLTLNSTIAQLPDKEKEEALRKKAWIINLRKRIIPQINTILLNDPLTDKHRKSLKQLLTRAKTCFIIIDKFRKENPYEKEYETPSWIDSKIEQNLINSIILKYKPDCECTPTELQKKRTMEWRRIKIIANLREKIITNKFSQIFGSLLILYEITHVLGTLFAICCYPKLTGMM